MELFFIRHGEHGGENSFLTDVGKEEVRGMKEQIRPNDTSIVFHPPGSRFSETAEIILGEMDSPFKRREVRQLSYMRIDQTTPYYKGLIESIRAHRCLEYHVLNSDRYIKESGEDISSYTTMAALVSRLLLKYISIQQDCTSEQVSTIQRVFCAREFIWSSFRAKVLEQKYGDEAMFKYVEWYSQTQEGQGEARKSIAHISTKLYQGEDIIIQISDIYGDDEIMVSDLENIIQQEEVLRQQSFQTRNF